MHSNELQRTCSICCRKRQQISGVARVLQVRCIVLQCAARCWSVMQCVPNQLWQVPVVHTAPRCNALQHTATQCNALQHNVTHCNTMQRTATHLQRRICCYLGLWYGVCVCVCVTWRIQMCAMTHSYVCGIYRSCVRHDSCTRVWHDSFIHEWHEWVMPRMYE